MNKSFTSFKLRTESIISLKSLSTITGGNPGGGELDVCEEGTQGCFADHSDVYEDCMV